MIKSLSNMSENLIIPVSTGLSGKQVNILVQAEILLIIFKIIRSIRHIHIAI